MPEKKQPNPQGDILTRMKTIAVIAGSIAAVISACAALVMLGTIL